MTCRRPDKAGKERPWYANGLRFECTRCGRCCAGEPGYVWVENEETHLIARFLKIPEKEFLRRFCRRVVFRTSLRERPNGECVLLTPTGCRIYPVRPAQCRSFPFWPQFLKRPERWNALKDRCAGVGHGRLYSRQEIEELRDGKRPT